nr:hypothetical protein L204_05125 [Cryptococcus depauperatus CBS 7855]
MGPPASTQPGPAQIPARVPVTRAEPHRSAGFGSTSGRTETMTLQSTQSRLLSFYSTGWTFPTPGNALQPVQKAVQLLRHPNNAPHGLQATSALPRGRHRLVGRWTIISPLSALSELTHRTFLQLNEMHGALYKADDYRNGTGEGAGQYRINKAQGDDERARIEESVDGEPFPIYFYHCQRLCPGFFRLGLDYKEGDFGQRCYRDDSTLLANPALTGFGQGLHAREV